VGGFVAAAWDWRGIFWLLAPAALIVAVAAVRTLPDDPGYRTQLHWPGAASLTGGAALVMAAATLAPQDTVPGWFPAVLAGAGVVLLVAFVRVSRGAAEPFVPVAALVETRFARSVAASFAQMVSLTVVLVAVPLYLTGRLHRSTGSTGVLVFGLPAAMALLAPAVGALCQRGRPRVVLRAGLLVLAAADVALGAATAAGTSSLGLLVVLLVGTGVGVALVQTPAATGATQSPAGRLGPALGVFNMMRFAGSALGAAWVAVVYPWDEPLLLFGGAAAVALLGFAAAFVGPAPERAAALPDVTSA
jgi:MFS family permease